MFSLGLGCHKTHQTSHFLLEMLNLHWDPPLAGVPEHHVPYHSYKAAPYDRYKWCHPYKNG